MSYCVKKRDCDAWIHYNPHTKEYFTADTRLGACVWNNLEFVKGFINLIGADMFEGEFFDVPKKQMRLKSTEGEIFDELH